MAKIIHKLFSKTTPTIPSLRIITSTLRTPQISDPDYLTAATTSFLPATTKSDFSNNPVPLLNPIPTQDAMEEEGADGSRTLWADSVKKKRKRKMNKHKYQKLRKRLRRKSS
ncbi:AURORA KINASE A-INTERACTING PROTEIN [Salix koriyanagi]|uniref:Small ribosomal subunit protein mS38 n=1 Tax=Salix koriyanagi TaxID=2511006 RepID=A0A9Q1A851_9ROSI|nr:AURORA KINASE A-INTERACTING PROTEIN [Salix koriyanagi]